MEQDRKGNIAISVANSLKDVSQRDSAGWADLMKQQDDYYQKYKKMIVDAACVGEFDTDYFKQEIGIAIDFHCGKITLTRAAMLLNAIEEGLGKTIPPHELHVTKSETDVVLAIEIRKL